jgi:predicted O-methyltransferase YrrM
MKFLRFYFFAIINVCYAFTIGILVKRNREYIYDTARFFGLSTKIKPVIPQVALAELCDVNNELVITAYESVNGNISLFELLAIASLVKQYQPKRLFEIGTFDGRTTVNMALNTTIDAHVYSLDLPASHISKTAFPLAKHEVVFADKKNSGIRFLSHTIAQNITQLFGDSATFDYLPYTGNMDLVFIDGSHAYDYVQSDTVNAFSLLKKEGGILIWHDLGVWDGVTQYLNEQYQNNPVFKNMVHIKDTSIAILIVS